MPFEGLPIWAQAIFYAAFLIILCVVAWTAVLFVISRRALRAETGADPQAADAFLWVFIVPALNAADINGANSGSSDGFTNVDPWANFSY